MVSSVGLFYRIVAKQGDQNYPWGGGLAMIPQGSGWYALTVSGNDLPSIGTWKTEAWLDFQFVANNAEQPADRLEPRNPEGYLLAVLRVISNRENASPYPLLSFQCPQYEKTPPNGFGGVFFLNRGLAGTSAIITPVSQSGFDWKDSKMKIGIIGSGVVGATAAYAMVMRGVGREIVLVDKNAQRAQAEADDVLHAVPFAHPLQVRAGDYPDLAGCRVVIITAGTAQKPGETRMDLLARGMPRSSPTSCRTF